MKKKVLYAAMALMSCFTMTSLHCQTFSELCQNNSTDTRSVCFAFENDAFGIPLVDEWDDLRTFGFFAGFSLSHCSVDFAYNVFTDRGTDEILSRRDDQIILRTSYRETWDLSDHLVISAGVGGSIVGVGDFHGLDIQSAFHRNISTVTRPIPITYATSSYKFTVGMFSNLAAIMQLESITIGGYLNAELDGFGNCTYRADLVVNERIDGPHISLGLEYQGSNQQNSASSVILSAQKAEEGLWLFDSFGSGNFNFETRWNPIANISTGSIKVMVNAQGKNKEAEQFRAIEFGMPIGSNAYEARYRFVPRWLALFDGTDARLAILVDRVSGWSKEPSTTYESNEAYRFIYAAIGLDASRHIASGHLVPFIDALAGIKVDTLHDQPGTRARLIDTDSEFGMVLEAGIRVLTEKANDGTRFGISVSPALEWLPVSGALSPTFRIRIISESGR